MLFSAPTYIIHPLAAPLADKAATAIGEAVESGNNTALMMQLGALRDNTTAQDLLQDFLRDQLAKVVANDEWAKAQVVMNSYSSHPFAARTIAPAILDGVQAYCDRDDGSAEPEFFDRIMAGCARLPALRSQNSELIAEICVKVLNDCTPAHAFELLQNCPDMATLAGSVIVSIDEADTYEDALGIMLQATKNPALMAELSPQCTATLASNVLEAQDETTCYYANLAAAVQPYPAHAHALASMPLAQTLVAFSTQEMGIGYPMVVQVVNSYGMDPVPYVYVGCHTDEAPADRVEEWCDHLDDTRRTHGIPRIFAALAELSTRTDPAVAEAARASLIELGTDFHNFWKNEIPEPARTQIASTLKHGFKTAPAL